MDGQAGVRSAPARDAPPVGLGAFEVAARRARFGPNRIVPEERRARLHALLHLLADPMALLLAGAGTVYLLLGETVDGAILLGALIPVLGIDVLLEARSREALRKLAGLLAPRARVVRDGEEQDVPSEDLVPGDRVLIREGDVLHADGVVRSSANLALDESPLTGESEPQEKRAWTGPAAPHEARFFAGSVALAGQAVGEVTETGARTRYGRIAGLVAATDEGVSPIQRKTGRLVRRLSALAVGVAALVCGLELLRGASLREAFLAAASFVMASIPEEFPLVFTLFLSLGAWRLGRRGVLVRRLASVETLGATTVLCLDKTGTLTVGRFALEACVPLDGAAGLLETAVLACESDARDPLERAILARAAEEGVDAGALHHGARLVRDHPFEPAGRHMSHVWEARDGRRRLAAKGALEGILEHCRLDDAGRAAALAANARLAGLGMRVLAVAGRDDRERALGRSRGEDERELTLFGLLGFRDPLRPEVPAAVAECQSAGIRLKLLTGDHPLTAHAIADAAGLLHDHDDGIVTGEELDALAADARAERIARASLFARIRPEQKHAIVEALQRAGETVAMTGDGINDAPALRRADLGVSLGRRGTEVARAAAQLVLLRDDFAALVAAVREGRHLFGNIQRAFLYVIAFHAPIVGLALVAPLLGLPILLLPVHLVWLELIVHPVSVLAFEGEPAPGDVMRRPPRDPRAPLLPRGALARSMLSGLLLGGAALGFYVVRLPAGVEAARGAALAVLVLGSLLLVRAEQALDRAWWRVPAPRARTVLVGLLVAASLVVGVQLPACARLLHVAPLPSSDWLLAAALAAAAVGWRALGRREE